MRRRRALTAIVIGAVALLLASYVVYTQRVVRELRSEAARLSRMSALVYSALTDTSETAPVAALLELSRVLSESGIPAIQTDLAGNPIWVANLPRGMESPADPRVRDYIRVLDAQNAPVTDTVTGVISHYGATRLVGGLRIIPTLQAISLALLVAAGVFLLVAHGRAERERIWAGMARESAHQIGTPLSSLHGWIEVVRDGADDPLLESAIEHMRADLHRLERVAHRFERIGRPPKRENVDLDAAILRVVEYFRARVPTQARPVQIDLDLHGGGLRVNGDRVLIEWMMESLIRNALDALAQTGGTIDVSAETVAGSSVRIRVADNGPGVPPAIRRRIFDAGFSTKERGWGIGLALTRRIVEDNHRGRIALVPSQRGAVFEVILPV
jgi:signal transduction histidine kinase